MLPAKTKTVIRWIGFSLSVVAIIFVVHKLKSYGDEIDFTQITYLTLPLLALSVAYCAANLSLALAWKDLLRHLGAVIGSSSAIRIYGVSQLAKYVPGNVFHFVGRQALGLDAGLPAWPLAKSVVWEIGVLGISGSLFVALVLEYVYAGVPAFLATGLFLAAISITIWMSNHWIDRWVARAVGWCIIFLALSGIIFLATVLLIVPSVSIQGSVLMTVCGAYVIAWLIGLITPGAPAGVGIREFVLYALLSPFINEANLLTAILLGRIVTVVGDVLFYILALIIGLRTVKVV